MKNGINLIPDEIKRARLIKKARTGLIATGVVYVAVLGLVFAGQRMEINDRKADLSAVEAKRDSLLSSGTRQADLGRKLADIRRAEAELTQRLNATAGLSGKKIAWAHVFKRLSAEMPEGVWLRGISTSEAGAALKRVHITGSATSNRPVAEFISALENSGLFMDLSLTYTQKREQSSGSVYDFELYMDLKKNGETVHDW
ncbi:MAG: PilN domain-containing protein [Deltaproteobacteria bacterium]|nr:PilN domain-containing protein [Deltaproteobacteria bacterium]